MRKYLLIFLVLSLIFLSHYFISGQAVYGDGIDYWAYMHSWYFDHNLDFNNEFRHFYSPQNNNSSSEFLSPIVVKTAITLLGKTDNIHPIGTSILLFPWYILADVTARFLNFFGFSFITNGYSDIYQIICGLGVVVYMTVAYDFTQRLCFHFSQNRTVSNLAAIAVFFSSQLLFYSSYDNLNSHFASYFVSVTFWLVLFSVDFSKIKWLICGSILVALASLVRIQDGLLIIPLLLVVPNIFSRLIAVFISFLLFFPQFYVWYYLYGIPLPVTYLKEYLHWNFLGSIFHYTNGLIRTPVNLLALAGLPYLKSGGWLFLSFVIPMYLIISFQGGWQAAAYGARMYISVLPFTAVLLSLLFSRWKLKTALFVVVFFTFINVVSLTSFVLYEKETNAGNKRGLEESAIIRLKTLFSFK